MRNLNTKNIVSDLEWRVRTDLAACARLIYDFNLDDYCYGHVFARSPDEPEHILVPAFGISFEEMQASDFIKIDLRGKVIFNPHSDLSYSKGILQFISIMDARRDINGLIHSHPTNSTAVSMLECGLLPYSQTAMRFRDIPYHEFNGTTIGFEHSEQMISDLGMHEALILKNHGIITVGEDIARAFNAAYFLEKACEFQIKAMSCGSPLSIPKQEYIDKTYKFFDPIERNKITKGIEMGVREWEALRRHLDAKDESYKL